MSCFYCDKIRSHDSSYHVRESEFDLGKDWARCGRHWRYLCSECGKPNHFQATFYCPDTGRFLCSACSGGSREVVEDFWGWPYYWEYRCPSCNEWHPSLDYLEYLGRHPYTERPSWEKNRHGLSSELSMAVSFRGQVCSELCPDESVTNSEIAESWGSKAGIWYSRYDEYGGGNRKYRSDPVLFRLLGRVEGLSVLDAGSGNGYLSRLLSRKGAQVVGVELSKKVCDIALRHEEEEPLGITYHTGTIGDMPYIESGSMDVVISNYVLMDCRDYEDAIVEFHRVLKSGGVALIVISHPCFNTPPVHGWIKIPPDSQRRQKQAVWMVDQYFARGSYQERWGPFDTPFIFFHRTLSDYYMAFRKAGFVVTDLEEPSISELGRKELPSYLVDHSLKIPWSIIFKLCKPV